MSNTSNTSTVSNTFESTDLADPLESTLFSSVLSMKKDIFWLERSDLPPEQIQQEWKRASAPLSAILDAEILPLPSQTDVELSPAFQKRQREDDLATGNPTKRLCFETYTSYQPEVPAQQTQQRNPMSRKTLSASHRRTLSFPSVPQQSNAMGRNLSSTPQSGALSFTGGRQHTDLMSPNLSNSSQNAMLPFSVAQNNAPLPAINNWFAEAQPFGMYCPPKASTQATEAVATRRSGSARMLPVRSFEPREYCQLDLGQPPPRRSQTTHLRRPSNSFSSHSELSSSHFSSSPQSTSQTNPTSVDMSRQASFANSSFGNGMSMLRLDSGSNKFNPPMPNADHELAFDQHDQSNLFTSHAGGITGFADGTDLPPNAAKDITALSFSNGPDPIMQRSGSNTSSASRLSRRAQEQAVHSSRPLAPKDGGVTLSSISAPTSSGQQMIRKQSEGDVSPWNVPEFSSSGVEMIRKRSEDGQVLNAVRIPQTGYNRPKNPKLMCDECNSRPQGFRGKMELQRHKRLRHAAMHEVWICKEKEPNGTFLADCKKCQGLKVYGAESNAAAHLRRVHFHKADKGRKGRGVPAEKRGGKGGGDDPPIEECRLWMYTREVKKGKQLEATLPGGNQEGEGEADEGDDEDDDDESEDDEDGEDNSDEADEFANATTEVSHPTTGTITDSGFPFFAVNPCIANAPGQYGRDVAAMSMPATIDQSSNNIALTDPHDPFFTDSPSPTDLLLQYGPTAVDCRGLSAALAGMPRLQGLSRPSQAAQPLPRLSFSMTDHGVTAQHDHPSDLFNFPFDFNNDAFFPHESSNDHQLDQKSP